MTLLSHHYCYPRQVLPALEQTTRKNQTPSLTNAIEIDFMSFLHDNNIFYSKGTIENTIDAIDFIMLALGVTPERAVEYVKDIILKEGGLK